MRSDFDRTMTRSDFSNFRADFVPVTTRFGYSGEQLNEFHWQKTAVLNIEVGNFLSVSCAVFSVPNGEFHVDLFAVLNDFPFCYHQILWLLLFIYYFIYFFFFYFFDKGKAEVRAQNERQPNIPCSPPLAMWRGTYKQQTTFEHSEKYRIVTFSKSFTHWAPIICFSIFGVYVARFALFVHQPCSPGAVSFLRPLSAHPISVSYLFLFYFFRKNCTWFCRPIWFGWKCRFLFGKSVCFLWTKRKVFESHKFFNKESSKVFALVFPRKILTCQQLW